MKIKAYQVSPEHQEAPLWAFDEMPEGLEIYGNRNFNRHTSVRFDEVLNCLEYGDFSDFEFTGYNAERLEELCNRYGTQNANNENIIAEALSIVTGQNWEYKQISGCCQSDWNYIYYRPDKWTEKALEYFEVEYFNTGEEWRIEDEEGNEEFVYTHEWKDDEKKREIAENIGVNPDEVTLYIFDGWEKTAKYIEM
jgi:hypothetical protein|nr:MAG TPA: hypothetical protein [Caudoviricetes sp.]